MKNRSMIIAAVVVIALVAGVVIIASSSHVKDSTMDGMEKPGTASTQDSPAASSTSANEAVATDSVEISNYSFMPETITVKVGTKVTWTNKDSVRHNVASDDSSMPNGDLIAKGESYSYTFTKAGTYKYHCDPHPYMHGTVIVTD